MIVEKKKVLCEIWCAIEHMRHQDETKYLLHNL